MPQFNGGRLTGVIHLNGNLLCAVDCETSGDDPGYHDLLKLAVLPLSHALEPWYLHKPFEMELKPKRPENYDPTDKKVNRLLFCHAQTHGMDPDRAADLFEEWVAKWNLAPGKMISPLAQNWPHDRGFLIDWLGKRGFSDFFDARYRDTMSLANAINDREDMKIEPAPFTRIGLKNLCAYFCIDNPHPHDPLSDCIATAAVYKKLLLM